MPKDLVTPDGLVVWTAAHSAYGRVLAVDADDAAKQRYDSEAARDHGATGTATPIQSPFRLLGQVADEDADLCWTRFRCFDPETGRWLSPDPLGVAGGLNLHGFDGAPSVVVDPLGLATNNKPHARVAEIQPNKHHRVGEALTEEEAVDYVRGGGDVMARDQGTARRVAAQAGEGPPEHDNPHGPGQKPHYHPTDEEGNRVGGHVMY